MAHGHEFKLRLLLARLVQERFSRQPIVRTTRFLASRKGFRDERRPNVRIIVSIPGSFSLADKRDALGERRVFACRVVGLSVLTIAFATTINVKLGERVIAQIDQLGKVEGKVIRRLGRGFVMSINASDEELERLAEKMNWIENRKNHNVPENRTDERGVPVNPYSRMILADGSTESCLVLEFSVSGATISANTVPTIGTVLAIGTVIGRVVRHFEGGFAVQFVERLNSQFAEHAVICE